MDAAGRRPARAETVSGDQRCGLCRDLICTGMFTLRQGGKTQVREALLHVAEELDPVRPRVHCRFGAKMRL